MKENTSKNRIKITISSWFNDVSLGCSSSYKRTFFSWLVQ